MANPTTNYGWQMPTPTDLVTDLPADFEIFGQSADSTVFANAALAVNKTIVDAKGDLIAASAADTVSRLAVGANDTVLTADSTAATGMKWAAAAGKVLQVVQGTYSISATSSSTTYADTGLTATITPSLSTSKVLVLVVQNGVEKRAGDVSSGVGIRLLRDGVNILKISEAVAYTNTSMILSGLSSTGYILDAPASASALVYKTQFKNNVNAAAALCQGNNEVSTIILMEIGA